MAQPSVSSYFIARKRGNEDEILTNKKKVICLDRDRHSSESLDVHTDSEDLATTVVFPKAQEHSSNEDEPKKVARMPTVRQGITPQRTTRSRKVHMQSIDGIEAPKVVNFWKGGNLSPQKKSKNVIDATTVHPTPKCSDESSKAVNGMSTPVKDAQQTIKSNNDSIEKTALVSSNGMKLDEIKKKLKGSNRLADLKTSLNKFNAGCDKLEQMEKKRLASAPLKPKAVESAPEATKSLKPFKSIELEIMR